MGRPSDYTEEKTEVICQRIALGESLRSVCRDEDQPDKTTVLRWLAQHEAFRTQYAQARVLQADHWSEEIVEISDDSTNDYVEREMRDGRTEEVPDHEHINRSRLRVDTRKWLMARMAPRAYGTTVGLEHSGTIDFSGLMTAAEKDD